MRARVIRSLQRRVEEQVTCSLGPDRSDRSNRSDRSYWASLERVLCGASKIYGAAMNARAGLYERGVLASEKLPCPVVSVGNLTVGGAGKTPMVAHVARYLKTLGRPVVVISRGYGGKAQRAGGIVSNGRTVLMGPAASGDEPYMLAVRLGGIPVVVGKNRREAGRRALSHFGPSVLVLDDGYQHLALRRDLNLLLLDSRQPFGNGCCLPGGSLREPLGQIRRADAFVFTRWSPGLDMERPLSVIRRYGRGGPVFRSFHVAQEVAAVGEQEIHPPSFLKGRPVFAFSGIARNAAFRETLALAQATVAGFAEFPDHYPYDFSDLEGLWSRARELKAEFVITSEKDYARMGAPLHDRPPLLVLRIEVAFAGGDGKAFEQYLASAVPARSG